MFGNTALNTDAYNTKQSELIDSQQNMGYHSSAERMLTMNTERDQIKIQKLLKIKENIESLARKEAMRYQMTMKKTEKREKLAKEYKQALKEEAKHKKLKYDARRIQAKDLM